MARTNSTVQSWTGGQHSFAEIPRAEIPRSVFDRSHGVKATFNSGYLIPIFVDEALPGDTFSLRCTSFTRMATPVFPVMDNIYQDYFFFAVPVRLVWDNFQRFMGERDPDPDSSIDFTVPQFEDVTTVLGDLSDYMGIPPHDSLTFNSLHHRAYNLIWNEWFRAEQLQDSVVVDKDDGPDTLSDYVLLRRGKRHDYFTSALPFTQWGDPVSISLGTSAPVTGSTLSVAGLTVAASGNLSFTTNSGANTFGVRPQATTINSNLQSQAAATALNHDMAYISGLDVGGSATITGTADLTAATAVTVNAMRELFQIQRFMEREARGGARYTELVRSMFGVVSPDARLQRPEYLGGGSTRINIHPVAKTSGATTAGSALYATLGAFATASAQGVGFTKSFTEHTLLLGLVQVRADLTYQQGFERMFSRQSRYDFYWPTFAHLGEQAILNKEIFADGTATDDEPFGYQERYAEYRYKPSRISGTFRSQAATPLDLWHLAIEFGSLPELDDVFIQDDSPFERIMAVPTEPEFYGDFWFQMRCVRPMPTFSVPGLIDHF